MKKLLAATIASLVLGLPLAATAAEGWVIADISLQAGPDTEYPSITELPAGSPVSIQGCIDGWTWCDVVAGNDRGWVPGTFLEEEYQNRRVVVVDYGPQIRIPVVSFSINTYWDQHYRSRPFYAQRQEFSARPIHPHAPPRPSGVAASTQAGGSQTQVRQARAPAIFTTGSAQNTASASTQNTRTTTATPSTNATSAETAGTTAAKDRQTREHATTQTAPQPARQPDERKQGAQAQAAPEQAPPPVPESKQVRTAQQHATDQPKQRQGEPKAKDELKKPPQKQQNKDEKDKDGDNGGG